MKQQLTRVAVCIIAILLGCNIQAAKKVFTLGDSTMAPYDVNTTKMRGWGMYFGNFLTHGWVSLNYAKGGRDSRAGYNELWQNAKDSVGSGDYVLIQFGHNDEKFNGMDNQKLQTFYAAQGNEAQLATVRKDKRGTIPHSTYKEWLRKIIREVKAKGATPVLISPVCRCYFGADHKITRAGQHDLGDKFDALHQDTIMTQQHIDSDNHDMDYPYHMRQLAKEEHISFVDMTTATKNLYEQYGSFDACYAALFDKGTTTDKTHYNKKGAMAAAQLCAQLLKEQGILAKHITIPTETKHAYDAVVSTTTELCHAIAAANSRKDQQTRYRILVKKGTYKMPTGAMKHYKHMGKDRTTVLWEGDLPDPITYITAANLSLIGEDRDATIITQDISNDSSMLFKGLFGTAHKYETIRYSPVFQLTDAAVGTYFQDITIKSGIGDRLGRNLAVYDCATNTIYKNTLLYGYQDTWTSSNEQGLYYFEGGQVRGRTDYLCGKGDAYFNQLELLQIAGGYTAVPSKPRNVGWVFKNCTISASGNDVDGTYTLGRPWGKATPVAVFIDTRMNVKPTTLGWNEMHDGWPARFAEWNSRDCNGVTIETAGRKTIFANSHENNPTLTEKEADTYSNMNRMFGDWQPTDDTKQAAIPVDIRVNAGVLTWTKSYDTWLWAICKDGNVIDFTEQPTYTAKQAGIYSVRAANPMGGLSAPSATVTVTL